MTRGAAAWQAELLNPTNRPVSLVVLEMGGSTGTIRLTNAMRSIIYGGNTYLAAAHLLTIGDIEETADLKNTEISMELSGVDSQYVSLFLTVDYAFRPITVYRPLVDESTNSVGVPVEIFKGVITGASITNDPESGAAIVRITAGSCWANMEQHSGRHTAQDEFQLFAPGDNFFEFCSLVMNAVGWGRKGP
jgi:hypothetical protein